MVVLFFLFQSISMAILPQTKQDLNVLEDELIYELEKNSSLKEAFPVLLIPPISYWEESKDDFSKLVTAMLQRVFKQEGSLVECGDCARNRVFIANDGRLLLNTGDLVSSDWSGLNENKVYREAKSVLKIWETPSGIQASLTRMSDQKILFYKLSDGSQDLNSVKQPLHLAREVERRKKGEALSYVFINGGWYPNGIFQMEFLEQWGSYNHHLSGLSVSLLNPNLAFGGTYHYMIPRNRKLNISTSAFFSIESMLSNSGKNNGETSLLSGFVGQFMVQYAIGGSWGVFGAFNTSGHFFLGITFFNPVLMPFLL